MMAPITMVQRRTEDQRLTLFFRHPDRKFGLRCVNVRADASLLDFWIEFVSPCLGVHPPIDAFRFVCSGRPQIEATRHLRIDGRTFTDLRVPSLATIEVIGRFGPLVCTRPPYITATAEAVLLSADIVPHIFAALDSIHTMARAARVCTLWAQAANPAINARWRHVRLGLLYIAGGRSTSGEAHRTIEVRDPLHDARTYEDPMPSGPDDSFCLASLGDYLYLLGGSRNRSKVLRFCPRWLKWDELCSMRWDRFGFGAAVLRGQIYAVGGASRLSLRALRSVERYDPEHDTWHAVAGMRKRRRLLGVAALGDRIYAAGGNVDFQSPAMSSVEVYDVDTDKWTLVRAMSVPRSSLAAVAHSGMLYVLGGYNEDDGDLATVERYDPSTDSWAPAPSMDQARANAAAISITLGIDGTGANDRKHLMIFGGDAGPLRNALASIEVLLFNSEGNPSGPWLRGFPGFDEMECERASLGVAFH